MPSGRGHGHRNQEATAVAKGLSTLPPDKWSAGRNTGESSIGAGGLQNCVVPGQSRLPLMAFATKRGCLPHGFQHADQPRHAPKQGISAAHSFN
jgi:hypothetical protein